MTVNVSGGGESAKGIVVHLTHLSRQESAIETDDSEQLQGRGQEKGLVEAWEPDLDAAQSRSRYRGMSGREPTKFVHNIVMSMPAGMSLVGVLKGRMSTGEQFVPKPRYAVVSPRVRTD